MFLKLVSITQFGVIPPTCPFRRDGSHIYFGIIWSALWRYKPSKIHKCSGSQQTLTKLFLLNCIDYTTIQFEAYTHIGIGSLCYPLGQLFRLESKPIKNKRDTREMFGEAKTWDKTLHWSGLQNVSHTCSFKHLHQI